MSAMKITKLAYGDVVMAECLVVKDFYGESVSFELLSMAVLAQMPR